MQSLDVTRPTNRFQLNPRLRHRLQFYPGIGKKKHQATRVTAECLEMRLGLNELMTSERD